MPAPSIRTPATSPRRSTSLRSTARTRQPSNMAPENETPETEETVVTDLADLQSPAAAAPAADERPALKVSNAPLREQELDAQGRAYATGRRKDAVARVWLKPGTGKVTVNGRDQEVFFARPTLRLI